MDEETCGNFKCQTCYPGGVIEVPIQPKETVVKVAKTYEM